MSKLPYQALKIWQKAMVIVEEVYKVTKLFPQSERFGLVDQLRRAAVSVPSNIAEGSQRTSDKDFYHFICIAKGSLVELETQLILSNNFQYIENEKFQTLEENIQELQRMLHSFGQSLHANR